MLLFFLSLGARWRWVVSFTPWEKHRPPPRQGKSTWYPLNVRPGGPHSQSWSLYKTKEMTWISPNVSLPSVICITRSCSVKTKTLEQTACFCQNVSYVYISLRCMFKPVYLTYVTASVGRQKTLTRVLLSSVSNCAFSRYVCCTGAEYNMKTIPNNTNVMNPITLCVLLYRHRSLWLAHKNFRHFAQLEKISSKFSLQPPSLRYKYHMTTRKHEEGNKNI